MESSLFISDKLLSITTFLYFFAMFSYVIYIASRSRVVGLAGTCLTAAGFLVETGGIVLRWVESYQMGIGRAPLTNLYESLVFFAWCSAGIYLYFEHRYRNRFMGAFVLLFISVSMAYASFSPNVSSDIQPLVPALQSNWLIYHVITCFFAYAAFAVACGVSMVYLVKDDDVSGRDQLALLLVPLVFSIVLVVLRVVFKGGITMQDLGVIGFFNLPGVLTLAIRAAVRSTGKTGRDGFLELFPSLEVLDDINYKAIAIGFPMLTLGIITGAAWANYAWGSYWSWDPKETWSLIAWFVYAAFLHARFTRGWKGVRAAMLSVLAFVSVIVTYLGVNLLLSGLHSYGSSQ